MRTGGGAGAVWIGPDLNSFVRGLRVIVNYQGTGTRRGRHRWVAERDFAWLHRNRRLLIRYERHPELHDAFLDLGCALICWQFLGRDGLR